MYTGHNNGSHHLMSFRNEAPFKLILEREGLAKQRRFLRGAEELETHRAFWGTEEDTRAHTGKSCG